MSSDSPGGTQSLVRPGTSHRILPARRVQGLGRAVLCLGSLARRTRTSLSGRQIPPARLAAADGRGNCDRIPGIDHSNRSWDAKLKPTVRLLWKLAKLAPVAYAGLVVYASATADARSTKEKLLMLRVLPTIHFPWAIGFVKGRLKGPKGPLDKGRVRS